MHGRFTPIMTLIMLYFDVRCHQTVHDIIVVPASLRITEEVNCHSFQNKPTIVRTICDMRHSVKPFPHSPFSHMSFPSLIDSPSKYLDHITSLGLDCAISQPLGSHYHESLALEWCEHMDSLLVHQIFFFLLSDTNCFQGKLGHMIGLHEHSKLVAGLSQLCTGSVAECESSLARQKAEDSAEVKCMEEKQKIEMEKCALEQEVEKQRRMKEME